MRNVRNSEESHEMDIILGRIPIKGQISSNFTVSPGIRSKDGSPEKRLTKL
jgi:hypothetical protein